MIRFGLIGKTLKHSFSQRYFSQKFQQLQLTDHQYELFELDTIAQVTSLQHLPGLKGLNVTIPYKETIISFLDEVDDKAMQIGAVNTIRISSDGIWKGFNTDYDGFRQSLLDFLPHTKMAALVLGTGGASKAVAAVLRDENIPFQLVSRTNGDLTYAELTPAIISSHQLIVNCTPLGTFPDTDQKPDIPYTGLTSDHYCFDLVYNPEETAFLHAATQRGAHCKNGLEMLHGQAEAAWVIWNS